MRNGTAQSQRSLRTSPDLGSGLHRQRLTSSLRVANSRLGPRETTLAALNEAVWRAPPSCAPDTPTAAGFVMRGVVTDVAIPRTRWGPLGHGGRWQRRGGPSRRHQRQARLHLGVRAVLDVRGTRRCLRHGEALVGGSEQRWRGHEPQRDRRCRHRWHEPLRWPRLRLLGPAGYSRRPRQRPRQPLGCRGRVRPASLSGSARGEVDRPPRVAVVAAGRPGQEQRAQPEGGEAGTDPER